MILNFLLILDCKDFFVIIFLEKVIFRLVRGVIGMGVFGFWFFCCCLSKVWILVNWCNCIIIDVFLGKFIGDVFIFVVLV